MRILLILVAVVIPMAAQRPVVRLVNVSRPAAKDFQIGDRFEVVISGSPNQPVSVRTSRSGAMDWSPVIGQTDTAGRWSTSGSFEKVDFGYWGEVWTVGGKAADPSFHFFVGAPTCPDGGRSLIAFSGAPVSANCETADGVRRYTTPPDFEPFRTPDGRLVAGHTHSNVTADQYRGEIMQSLLLNGVRRLGKGWYGNAAATLIMEIIGVNALGEDETRNAVAIIRGAYDDPLRIPQADKDPSPTLAFLHYLADSAGKEVLKQEIAETIVYIQTR